MKKTKLISFDFDMTLTKNASAMQHFSKRQDIAAEIAKIEARFMSYEITTADFSDLTSMHFKGMSQSDLNTIMDDLELIDNCRTAIDEVRKRGIDVIISSVGYYPLIQSSAAKLNIETFSGVHLKQENGIFTGGVKSYFSEYNKITFVQAYAIQNNINLDEIVAVGDSKTDIPLFNVVGTAIALNANPDAKAQAHHVIDSTDLTSILDVIC